jgi:hypothetical protein
VAAAVLAHDLVDELFSGSQVGGHGSIIVERLLVERDLRLLSRRVRAVLSATPHVAYHAPVLVLDLRILHDRQRLKPVKCFV